MDVTGSPWPFADPRNVAAITTVNVLEHGDPILLVTHDEDDGMWQLLCGKANGPANGRVVGLGGMYDRDPTIGQLADLPLGWRAWRPTVAAPWQRSSAATDETC